jgi:hypothetical protein
MVAPLSVVTSYACRYASLALPQSMNDRQKFSCFVVRVRIAAIAAILQSKSPAALKRQGWKAKSPRTFRLTGFGRNYNQ